MTRETKIGLLVGLAFIIVIGILLSDQLMRSTEPPPAQLGSAADTLRRGTVTPASRQRAVAPVTSAEDASPDNVVPTHAEMARKAPPVTFVEIRPGDGGGNTVVVGPQGQQYVPVNPGGPEVGNRVPPGGTGNVPRSLEDVAAAAGETLVGLDGQPLRAKPLPNGQQSPVPPAGGVRAPANNVVASAAGMKAYVVQPGDSLSKIAQKMMGSASKANRDAIVKANPSLAANPDKVVIGLTYNIPAAPPVAVANAVPTPAPAPARAAPPAPARPMPAAKPVAPPENIYVVQPGDNLTRIAKDQAGDISAVAAIKELNKDVVKDWNVIVVGTKLRLPGKSVASAE